MKSSATPRLKGRNRRHLRIRKKVTGTAERPRLSVFRSLNHIYAQLVDDLAGRTILTVSSRDKEVAPKLGSAKGKIVASKVVGQHLAAKAKEKGIERVCFDRSGYLYHGRVKAVADGAREGGLNF
jgi:large subunit ribosomal protein L18